jgi:transketolase C-terminal domain/subunit
MSKHPYRTVSVALAGMVSLLAGLAMAGHWPAAAGAYGTFAATVGLCVSAVAAKAYGEHKVKAGQPPAQ